MRVFVRIVFPLTLATWACVADAQMYKCGNRWQDTPCAGQVKRVEPGTPAPTPDPGFTREGIDSKDPEKVRRALLAAQDGAQRCVRLRANKKDAKHEHMRTRENREREMQRLNCAQSADQGMEEGCAKAGSDPERAQACGPYAKRKVPAKPKPKATAKAK